MREFAYDISEDIKARWSPRAFSGEPPAESDLMALLEAARYAPSCFNEQPWRFVIATHPDELTALRGCLSEGNQVWAGKAPVLLAILAKQSFDGGERPNYWHMFDAGTAWGFLSLEAQRRGLITHAMGGFDREKARQVLGVPVGYVVITIVAVGKYGDATLLPPEVLSREKPGLRKPLSDIARRGKFEK